jgi:hypothetical protein
VIDEPEVDLLQGIALCDEAFDEAVEPFAAVEAHDRDVDERLDGRSPGRGRVGRKCAGEGAAPVDDRLNGRLVDPRIADAAHDLQGFRAAARNPLPKGSGQLPVEHPQADAEAVAGGSPFAPAEPLGEPQRHRRPPRRGGHHIVKPRLQGRVFVAQLGILMLKLGNEAAQGLLVAGGSVAFPFFRRVWFV